MLKGAPISTAVDQRHPPVIRAMLLAPWFAWMSWTLTWYVHPAAWNHWTEAVRIEITLWCSLLAVVGVLWALVRTGRPIHQIGPLLIAVHALVGILISMVSSDRLLPFVLFLMGVPVALPATFIFSTRRQDKAALRPVLELTCISILLPALLLFAWAPVSVAIVRHQALSVASGDPFCIQVPADYVGRERQATHWLQLSGLQMQTPWTNGGGSDDYQFSFHAVLVVMRDGKDEFHNWSYKTQSFHPLDSGAKSGLHVHRDCEPSASFFDGLAWSGTWTPFVRPPLPQLPQLSPLPEQPVENRPKPAPINNASEWEMDFWTNMFVRYAGMRALIEACNVVVDVSVLREIRRLEDDAKDRLGMTPGQAGGHYNEVLLELRVKSGVCNRGNRQFQDMVASFPRGEAGQR